MQHEVYEKLDEEGHRWLKCNIELKKVASIISALYQKRENTFCFSRMNVFNSNKITFKVATFSGIQFYLQKIFTDHIGNQMMYYASGSRPRI